VSIATATAPIAVLIAHSVAERIRWTRVDDDVWVATTLGSAVAHAGLIENTEAGYLANDHLGRALGAYATHAAAARAIEDAYRAEITHPGIRLRSRRRRGRAA
jgi:putative ubiquitin-RnfH superfamily antitoxin RatB of RatAB toxin-antitoxin module